WDIDKISIFDSTLQMGNFLISLFILIACSMVCMVEIGFERKKNEASIQMEIEQLQLKQRLQLDELTGIFNRKALHDAMEDMEGKVSDNNYILTIADIDNFKSINDHLGHHVGDYCLKEFAKVLGENCGKATIFRYGGDEFCLLFCNADINEAVSVCEQIQLKLSNLHFEPHAMLKMTASFGLAEYSDQVNTTRLFIHADQALYEAKEVRNNICVFQPKVKSME
ncbi:MAG: GGDEF domain-containing protein, partial [Lachnospiraceae bacterium]|nr:GGDEF domain-containing protein [Lachnospiraceae bacterium]